MKALDHPLYRLLHDEPNPEMTSFVFRETLMTHLLLWGNAFTQVLRNGRDEVGGVWVFRTVCFERVVLSSPGRVWPGRMDDHEEVLEAHA